jgi:hypothetical protein
MKIKVYEVVSSSYETADNYLHQESYLFDDKNQARTKFESLRNSIQGDVYGDDDCKYDADEDESENRYEASREVGTEFEYQAIVELKEKEIDIPFVTDRRKYGMTLKEVRDEIANFTGDKKHEAMRKAKIFAHNISIAHVCRIRLSFGHRTDEHGNRTEDHNWLQIQWTDQDGDSDTFSIIE